MSDVLFCGCSYVSGEGFNEERENPNLWVNLLCNSVFFKEYNKINVGKAGRSNQAIFSDAVQHLTEKKYEYAFVSWTSMPRYELELGVETYSTRQVFLPGLELIEHRLNDIVYNKEYLQKINDRFTSLAHQHYEILNLIFYVNSLIRLAKLTNTKLFFINSLCPWDDNYFVVQKNVLPEAYSNFTKKLINVVNRDDDEIFNIYSKMHDEYHHAGGIQEDFWLNLYQSLRSMLIDRNDDNIHPGPQSNRIYHTLLESSLKIKIKN